MFVGKHPRRSRKSQTTRVSMVVVMVVVVVKEVEVKEVEVKEEDHGINSPRLLLG